MEPGFSHGAPESGRLSQYAGQSDGPVVIGVAIAPTVSEDLDAANPYLVGAATWLGSNVLHAKAHKKGARPSTKDHHEKGQSRTGKDRPGGGKGDDNRPYRQGGKNATLVGDRLNCDEAG